MIEDMFNAWLPRLSPEASRFGWRRFGQHDVAAVTKGLARLLAFGCTVLTWPRPGYGEAHDRSEQVNSLMQRISAPTATHMRAFTESGMTGVRPHTLTAEEQAKLRAALERLPALNLEALSSHLHQFAFVDGIPGEGTGLTGPAKDITQFDMTFRASLFEESLSDFLTRKDNFVFSEDKAGTKVTVTGTGTDALTYVLLHESTHVLDLSCGITAQAQNNFGVHIWTTSRELAQPWSESPAAQTYFRGKPKISMDKAPDLYASLAKSPFVSFYATASAQEDLAELVAHREIAVAEGGDFTISVQVPGQQGVLTWHPLAFPAVQARLAQVDALEQSDHGCPAH